MITQIYKHDIMISETLHANVRTNKLHTLVTEEMNSCLQFRHVKQQL